MDGWRAQTHRASFDRSWVVSTPQRAQPQLFGCHRRPRRPHRPRQRLPHHSPDAACDCDLSSAVAAPVCLPLLGADASDEEDGEAAEPRVKRAAAAPHPPRSSLASPLLLCPLSRWPLPPASRPRQRPSLRPPEVRSRLGMSARRPSLVQPSTQRWKWTAATAPKASSGSSGGGHTT